MLLKAVVIYTNYRMKYINISVLKSIRDFKCGRHTVRVIIRSNFI